MAWRHGGMAARGNRPPAISFIAFLLILSPLSPCYETSKNAKKIEREKKTEEKKAKFFR
jgi:hypothetical protein